MEPLAPAWLTSEFLTNCLQQNGCHKNIEIENFKVSFAVPPGNNYCSIVLRVKVEYKIGNSVENKLHLISMIIKTELNAGPLKDMMDSIDDPEYSFYKMFIPEARKFTETSFAPKPFLSTEFSAIVLEDLTEQGFVMVDKSNLLDFEHCCLYVNAAAKLHAVSFAIHKENPQMIETLGKLQVFSDSFKNHDFMKKIVTLPLKCIAERIERTSELKKYSKVIRDTCETIWYMLVEAYKPSEFLNTLTQGDPWATNMMFKYDDKGAVCDIKLLDFQGLRYGSPITDLMFFIWGAANHDVRRNKTEQLYQMYLRTFNDSLKKFHCTEILSYKKFKESVKILSPIAVNAIGMLAIVLHPKPMDFNELFQSEDKEEVVNPYEIYFDENFCTHHLPQLLDQLEKFGVLDYLEEYNCSYLSKSK